MSPMQMQNTIHVDKRFQRRKNSDVRLPGARDLPVEDLPSDISDDEWGEIHAFGQHLHD